MVILVDTVLINSVMIGEWFCLHIEQIIFKCKTFFFFCVPTWILQFCPIWGESLCRIQSCISHLLPYSCPVLSSFLLWDITTFTTKLRSALYTSSQVIPSQMNLTLSITDKLIFCPQGCPQFHYWIGKIPRRPLFLYHSQVFPGRRGLAWGRSVPGSMQVVETLVGWCL